MKGRPPWAGLSLFSKPHFYITLPMIAAFFSFETLFFARLPYLFGKTALFYADKRKNQTVHE